MKLRGWRFAASAALTALLGLVGCMTPHQSRSQKPDEVPPDDRYELKVIADVTEGVGDAGPYAVAGVGLVTNLEGTGSATPPSGWRSRLEGELQRRHVVNFKELMQDTNNSLVLVTGMIPPGAHKGDPIDVEVSLPPGSTTISLRGGYLQECLLIDYELISRLDSKSSSDHPGQGLPRAKASGRLLVDLGVHSAKSATTARIWSGGRSLLDRTLNLSLDHDNQKSVRMVVHVTERINETFSSLTREGGTGSVASPGAYVAAKNDHKGPDRDHPGYASVVIGVPQQYRHNLPRYLRVVRMIPLHELKKKGKAADAPTDLGTVMARYRHQLEADVLDPECTVTAALRLEALGKNSVGALKRGLRSEHVLVRFCCAEALAYLDCADGATELSHIVAEQPYLRAYALTALASMDEGPCRALLQDLLAQPDPEARYGAYRALRALEEGDGNELGECINHSFWMDHVATNSAPMVHVCTSRRAEIVLFGQDTELVPGFSLLAGNFVLASSAEDQHCTVSRRVAGERQYRQCSLKVEDVIRTMGSLGAQYNDLIEFLSNAYRIRSLKCELCFDALPQAPTVQELAKAGRDAHFRAELARTGKLPEAQDRTDEELFGASSELPATPGLFEKTSFGSGPSFAERPQTGRGVN